MSDQPNDQQKRTWAIEQAIKLHAGNGMATEKLMEEAAKLVKFVEPPPSK